MITKNLTNNPSNALNIGEADSGCCSSDEGQNSNYKDYIIFIDPFSNPIVDKISIDGKIINFSQAYNVLAASSQTVQAVSDEIFNALKGLGYQGKVQVAYASNMLIVYADQSQAVFNNLGHYLPFIVLNPNKSKIFVNYFLGAKQTPIPNLPDKMKLIIEGFTLNGFNQGDIIGKSEEFDEETVIIQVWEWLNTVLYDYGFFFRIPGISVSGGLNIITEIEYPTGRTKDFQFTEYKLSIRRVDDDSFHEVGQFSNGQPYYFKNGVAQTTIYGTDYSGF